MDIAFSRPLYVIVCASDEYIHGIQVVVKMYPEQDDDLDHIEDEQTREAVKEMNKVKNTEGSSYYATHMDMIGTYQPPCQKMLIDKEDKIVYIDA